MWHCSKAAYLSAILRKKLLYFTNESSEYNVQC